jgi:hypothetical protein
MGNHGLGLLDWGFGPDGGEDVVRGTDRAVVEDGKIRRLWTLVEGRSELA